jgi:hypothetical protein
MILRFFGATLLLLVSAAGAQELDIYDVNDFVDPRALGAHRFVVSRLVAGATRDYVDLLRPTNDDVLFAHLATSVYVRSWQLNIKTTRIATTTSLGNDLRGEVPRRRHSLQLGRYYTLGGDAALRTEVTWSRAEYLRQGRPVRISPIYTPPAEMFHDRELGIEADLRSGRVGASLVYLQDKSPKDAFTRHRVALLHRLPRVALAGFKLDSSLAAGAFRSRDNWERITLLPAVEVTSPAIPWLDLRFHARYEPTRRERRTTHQVAFFFDRALFAKAF